MRLTAIGGAWGKLVDGASRAAGWVAMVAATVLAGVMLWEVGARMFAGAPTLWSADLARYLNGTLFAAGVAYGLLTDVHVRIDFAANALPSRWRHLVQGLFLTGALAPTAAFLAHSGWRRTLRAIDRGQVELVSAWQPVVWPILAILTAGLGLLAFKALRDGLADLAAFVSGGRGRG